MTNYICINGQKAELTEEQLKVLGIELPKKNPFERAKDYYFITSMGGVNEIFEAGGCNDTLRYDVANYCTDKVIMEQRALHEILNRLLWRYSMEHDGDKIDWENNVKNKYCIMYDHETESFYVDGRTSFDHIGVTHFYTEEVAMNAIEEIVIPFMEAHPEFVW